MKYFLNYLAMRFVSWTTMYTWVGPTVDEENKKSDEKIT